MPPHARAGSDGRGHRFAAYAQCSMDAGGSVRVAFDLDGTLIPVGRQFQTEPPARRVLGVLANERLRAGAGSLLRELVAEGHEVWVYTTSLRPEWQIRLLFRAYGVRLSGVVNQGVHDEWHGQGGGMSPSKFPPAFGIDLLVDDSCGVAAEGQEHGFHVLVVSPSDESWANEVRTACRGNGGRHRTSA